MQKVLITLSANYLLIQTIACDIYLPGGQLHSVPKVKTKGAENFDDGLLDQCPVFQVIIAQKR